MKVGVLTTHPIQYQVPWLRLLHADPSVDLHVFFCVLPDAEQQGEGFGVAFNWDVPLLDGYRWQLLENVAAEPSLTRFTGCDTPGIGDIVREGGWDAFIVNGWVVKSCLQTLLACRMNGVPCIVRGEVNGLRRRAWWKRLGHRLLLSQFAAVLAIGRHNREYVLDQGIPADRVFSTPYGVENDRFPEADRSRREPGAPFRFLFCGKLESKKRPGDLLEAAARLAGMHGGPRFEVVLVGEGELRDELEAIARRSGIPVDFRGFVNQGALRDVYSECDCLVLPSDSGETWGLVVNEAMATGMPAIVSDAIGSANDLVVDGETGWVVPLGDVERLTSNMRTVACDPPNTRSIGAAAAFRVRAAHAPEHVSTGVLEALCSVCGRTAAGDTTP